MLMSHYLDGDFKKEYLEIPSKIKSKRSELNSTGAALSLAYNQNNNSIWILVFCNLHIPY